MRTFVTCDVFTAERFGGNPLAVVLDGSGLTDAQMLTIAKEFNYSETTFVLPADNARHTARVRIFTPHGELPFAGHPTVGTAYVLASNGTVATDVPSIVLEEAVGPVRVQITRDASGQVTQCTLTSPRNPQSRVQLLAPAEAAALLSLPLKAIAALPIAPWSCGVPFLVIPIASVQALSDCALDPARWKTLLKGRWAEKTYPAFIDAAARTARVRMFKATASVMEDPATGAAAAAMAGYLAAHIETQNGRFDWTLLQGQDMGRPSEIALRFDRLDGYAQNVQVGGAAVAVMRGELAI